MDKKSDSVYRFAPSPTGVLHIGGARTAIFNWLLAKNSGGKFLLRIEDTDRKRSTKESIDQILKSLAWLEINWEGEPYYQSQAIVRHKQFASQLLDDGNAYRCFCRPETLQEERKRAEAKKSAFLYDGRCARLSAEEIQSNLDNGLSYTLRLAVKEGETAFDDAVRGRVRVDHSELDDFIIIRSDGTPVYHLAVVVDDHDMGVTHVIRGDDHLSNTPKQILIYQSLGWEVPQFSHLPLIHGIDGGRLSKRHGATSVEEFRSKGILSDALFNYLCLLGWAPGNDKEIMSRQELINLFSLDRVNKNNATFDEKKLEWINGKYLSFCSNDQIINLLGEILSDSEAESVENEKESFTQLIELVKIREHTLTNIYQSVSFFFMDPDHYEEKGVEKYFKNNNALNLLEKLKFHLKQANYFEAAALETDIRSLAEDLGIKAGVLIHPLRLALTGRVASPGIFDVLQIIGREKVIRRLNNAIRFMEML